MTDDTTNDRDSATLLPKQALRLVHAGGCLLLPLLVLVFVGWINGRGAWPTFRQQDTNVLHWILTINSEALKGLNQDLNSDGPDSGNSLYNAPKNYLTLNNMNLSGRGLSSSDLSYMNLENVNLAGAQLVNSNFSCTDLTRVDFSGAKLMNSKFDFSECQAHISTDSLRCTRDMQQITQKLVSNTKWPFNESTKFTCLEATFVGADFSGAQIRGARGRRRLDSDKGYCKHLLVLVGNMSGATFNKAHLTCVALIHRSVSAAPDVPAPKAMGNGNDKSEVEKYPALFIFNGISFAEARLDRVALLKGSFKFTQFERADLMGLFLNIGVKNADIDYSRFNEIRCMPPSEATNNHKNKSKDNSKSLPCLWVYRDAGGSDPDPLHLNFLWSTLVANLEPTEKDSFLCTPEQDLPAWVEGERIESAAYQLLTKSNRSTKPTESIKSTKMEPGDGLKPEVLDCPAYEYNKSNERPHHILSPSKSLSEVAK
jgi:uncharacterized protein YjbI with pentapeptide repeats